MTEVYDGTGEYHRLWTQQKTQTQNSSYTHGTTGGTADVITLTLSPPITAYATGQQFSFVASGTNTTAVTLNVDGLGAKSVTKNGTTALVAGDIQSGQTVDVTYDGTRFQITNPAIVNYVTLDTSQTITGTKTFGGEVNFTSTISATSAVFKGAVPLVFEGATDNAFETSLAITDPTADRIISMPDASGEIALFSSIPVSASAAQMEDASSLSVWVSPGRVQSHPAVPKAWVRFNGTGTVSINSSYNVSSITDGGAGIYTVNFTTGFSSPSFGALVFIDKAIGVADAEPINAQIVTQTSSTCVIRTYELSANTLANPATWSAALTDMAYVSAVFFGDQ